MKKPKATIESLTFALGFMIGCMMGLLSVLAIMVYITLSVY